MVKPTFDLLRRRENKFTLWIPGQTAGSSPPLIVLGTISSATSLATFNEVFKGALVRADKPDLWELDPNTINPPLKDGAVYSYWFKVVDTSSAEPSTILVTDPLAYTIDYRLTQSRDDNVQPASVIKFRDHKLWPCDIDGNEPKKVAVPAQEAIPDNNHLVIYELPISWAKGKEVGNVQVDVGTFKDVLALFDVNTTGDRFKDIPSISHEAIVNDLGINALEILPVADAKSKGEWGYATAHYFAPDADLGAASDLVKVVEYIHSKNIRLFLDVVMAFGHDPYGYIALDQFHIDPRAEPKNPDSYQSHQSELRDGYGGRSWRYLKDTLTYDPQSGDTAVVHPAWAFHQAHLHRWMSDFGVGGYRLDSVNNIANYSFVHTFKEDAWKLYRSRYSSPSDAKFLVIGEELSDPIDFIASGTLNALWNEPFQGRLRSAIIGEDTTKTTGDNFEWTVRKMIDCTLDSSHPFTDGAQAINYITSHDTEGNRKERLFNFLQNCNVTDMERRAKLAFACLLTAVGIPMIFAGEEFCDQMDPLSGQKQIDPVNYERKAEPWRSDLFNYVSNLVKFRTQSSALGDDDTDFIHVDAGGKIMAWKRGRAGQAPVVVVANFSDQDTVGSEYIVHNFPETGRTDWREVTQNRAVPQQWIGREPLMHWEAKVYTY
jgi:pullulanase